MIKIQDNLDRLNRNLAEYAKHTSKSVQQAVAHQGSKIGWELSKLLQAEQPGKGTIKAERLAALKAGMGVTVRKSIREKVRGGKRYKKGTLNLQARRVEAELNMRERSRGFLRHGAKFSNRPFQNGQAQRLRHWGKYRQLLATAGLSVSEDSAKMTVNYGGPNNELGEILNRPRFEKYVAMAIGNVADDIQVYLDDKLAQANLKQQGVANV